MMKKILTAALCAAMLLSMAGISYSADSTANPSGSTIQVLPAQPKPIKPVARVTEPDVSEDDAEQSYFCIEATNPAFIESMQKFGAKHPRWC